ncbi:hypothetical protein BDV12DRAFT_204240 [Aspergillus spectabilis]
MDGLITVRAFGWQSAYKQRVQNILTTSQRPYYGLYCVQQWLILVLDLTVAGLTIILAGIAVAVQVSSSTGLVALALVNTSSSTTLEELELMGNLRDVQLWDHLGGSSQSLDLIMSESLLPHGQRQLLSLARALARRSSSGEFLLLDEATSQLGAITEGIVRRVALTAFLDDAIIAIAYRLETVLITTLWHSRIKDVLLKLEPERLALPVGLCIQKAL